MLKLKFQYFDYLMGRKLLLLVVTLVVSNFFVTLFHHQVPLSMGFSRQEYWVGCHTLLQGIFLTQGSNLGLLCLLYW